MAARKTTTRRTTRTTRTAARYQVVAGRVILRDGVPFIGITRQEGTRPVEADEITHVIAACLNRIGH